MPFYILSRMLLSNVASSDMKLDITKEDDDDSGVYQGSSGGKATISHLGTRDPAHDKHEHTESEPIVRLLLGHYLSLGLLINS